MSFPICPDNKVVRQEEGQIVEFQANFPNDKYDNLQFGNSISSLDGKVKNASNEGRKCQK